MVTKVVNIYAIHLDLWWKKVHCCENAVSFETQAIFAELKFRLCLLCYRLFEFNFKNSTEFRLRASKDCLHLMFIQDQPFKEN